MCWVNFKFLYNQGKGVPMKENLFSVEKNGNLETKSFVKGCQNVKKVYKICKSKNDFSPKLPEWG